MKIRNNLFLQKKKLSKKYTKYLNFKFSNKKLNWKYLINPASANLMG